MLPFIADLPPHIQERVVCSITAAVKYEVPAYLVLAVAEKEGGRPGQWVENANGTYDIGPMQFNTAYITELSRYGITTKDVAATGCYPYELAAWRLLGHISNDSGDFWTRAANYHSRTPSRNAVYRADLIRRSVKWAYWIEANFLTKRTVTDAPQGNRKETEKQAINQPQYASTIEGGSAKALR